MGQISGVNTQSITNIAGIPVANISYVGPVSSAALGLGGGGISPANFPYKFTPGATVTGATFTKAEDVSNPASYKILGANRGDDSFSKNPTFELSNITNKIYNLSLEEATSTSYTISQWVKINNFPKRSRNGVYIRKKRTALSKYDFKTSSIGGLSDGYIEFGAMAPYYTNGVNFEKKYQYQFAPLSFGVCISNYKHPVTLYTDYRFQLETWYMLTVEIFINGTPDSNELTKNVKLYVNGEVQNTAIFFGKPWSLKVKSKSYNKNRNHGNSGGARLGNIFANIPEFKDYYLNSIYNQPEWDLIFKSFVNILEMNHASFSPVTLYEPGNNNGIITPTFKSGVTSSNSSVDFGELNIYNSYNGSNVSEMYNATFSYYI
jgi:hypothetical protein